MVAIKPLLTAAGAVQTLLSGSTAPTAAPSLVLQQRAAPIPPPESVTGFFDSSIPPPPPPPPPAPPAHESGFFTDIRNFLPPQPGLPTKHSTPSTHILPPGNPYKPTFYMTTRIKTFSPKSTLTLCVSPRLAGSKVPRQSIPTTPPKISDQVERNVQQICAKRCGTDGNCYIKCYVDEVASYTLRTANETWQPTIRPVETPPTLLTTPTSIEKPPATLLAPVITSPLPPSEPPHIRDTIPLDLVSKINACNDACVQRKPPDIQLLHNCPPSTTVNKNCLRSCLLDATAYPSGNRPKRPHIPHTITITAPIPTSAPASAASNED